MEAAPKEFEQTWLLIALGVIIARNGGTLEIPREEMLSCLESQQSKNMLAFYDGAGDKVVFSLYGREGDSI